MTDDPNLIDPVNLFLYYVSLGCTPIVAHEKSQRTPGVVLQWPRNVRLSVASKFDEASAEHFTADNVNQTKEFSSGKERVDRE